MPIEMTPKRLIFVRHGQSVGNVLQFKQRVMCGIPNRKFALTDVGESQAIIIVRYLQENYGSEPPDICFHSGFLRTKITLGIILREFSGASKSRVVEDPRLDEKWSGIFHELVEEDIKEKHPEEIEALNRLGWYDYRPLRGENAPDVEQRIKSFISDPRWIGRTILVVGHGRWFILLQKVLHNLSSDYYLQAVARGNEVPNCCVIQYDKSDSSEFLPKIVVPWEGRI